MFFCVFVFGLALRTAVGLHVSRTTILYMSNDNDDRNNNRTVQSARIHAQHGGGSYALRHIVRLSAYRPSLASTTAARLRHDSLRISWNTLTTAHDTPVHSIVLCKLQELTHTTEVAITLEGMYGGVFW